MDALLFVGFWGKRVPPCGAGFFSARFSFVPAHGKASPLQGEVPEGR